MPSVSSAKTNFYRTKTLTIRLNSTTNATTWKFNIATFIRDIITRKEWAPIRWQKNELRANPQSAFRNNFWYAIRQSGLKTMGDSEIVKREANGRSILLFGLSEVNGTSSSYNRIEELQNSLGIVPLMPTFPWRFLFNRFSVCHEKIVQFS